MIGAGEVFLDERLADKPGHSCSAQAQLRVRPKSLYVSRGGLKLAAALAHFDIRVAEAVCADIGASSGGFSDCLLQNGARQVFAIDVGYGQLAWKIRQDPRVTVLERFNARHITPDDIGHAPLDLAVLDLSFISLTTVLPAVARLFPGPVAIVALVKPQFELAREEIGAGGVVTDPGLHAKAVAKIAAFATTLSLTSAGTLVSPIAGPKGNREFLIHLVSPPAGSPHPTPSGGSQADQPVLPE
jgi:23S rRNA (cytidine1920-2'-O)/16S rRNA (cytidine1409-2'-O)-methyltransferase